MVLMMSPRVPRSRKTGEAYAVIDGTDGHAHHVCLRGIEAFADAPPAGGIVEVRRFGGPDDPRPNPCSRQPDGHRPRPALDHQLAWPYSPGETYALQLLQPADGETARVRIIGRHPDRRVEARPALRFHLALESGADFMLGPWGRARPRPGPRPASAGRG
jgi:hypothetical protein